jgi:hypothetical protein
MCHFGPAGAFLALVSCQNSRGSGNAPSLQSTYFRTCLHALLRPLFAAVYVAFSRALPAGAAGRFARRAGAKLLPFLRGGYRKSHAIWRPAEL